MAVLGLTPSLPSAAISMDTVVGVLNQCRAMVSVKLGVWLQVAGGKCKGEGQKGRKALSALSTGLPIFALLGVIRGCVFRDVSSVALIMKMGVLRWERRDRRSMRKQTEKTGKGPEETEGRAQV